VRCLVPPPLRPGDRIGIAAPAGPIRVEDLERGLAYLSARGFEPVLGEHLTDRRAYLAGADEDRRRDLDRLLSDPGLSAIWFARGGYGSARIVSRLDLGSLRRHPKALIGYSDVTVLQAAAYRAMRLVTFHGPMISSLGDAASFDEESLWRTLASGGGGFEHRIDASAVLRPGAGEGPLVGGCLSLLVSLVGTPFEVPTAGTILFWEEVNEEPWRIDRMLGQLRLAGRLENLCGMVVGRLVNCRAKDPANDVPLEEILHAHLAGTTYPVVLGLPAGHCPGKITLPLGRRMRLDTAEGRLSSLPD
jgi:muramoyltetrapeptide carboxypeptidase